MNLPRLELANRDLSEDEIQRAICHYLTVHKIPHTETDAKAVLDKEGKVIKGRVNPSWPDITAVIPPHVSPLLVGRMMPIEVKTRTGKLRPGRLVKRFKRWVYVPGQREVLEDLRRAEAIAIVARSIDDVIEGLRLAEDAVKTGKPMSEALPELPPEKKQRIRQN